MSRQFYGCGRASGWERWAAQFDDAPFGFQIVDAEGVIRAVSESYCSLLGYDRRQLLGRPVWTLSGAGREASVRGRFEGRLATQVIGELTTGAKLGVYQEEVLLACGQSRILESHDSVMLDLEGEVAGFSSYVFDVTERDRAERKLQRRERLLLESAQISRLGSFEWDLDTGQQEWSEECQGITGAPAYEPLRMDLFVEFVHPGDRADYLTQIKKSLREHSPFDFEFRLTRSDGKERTCRARGRVIRDGCGKPVTLLGTMQDITEQKQVAGDLLRTRQFLGGEREILSLLVHRAALDHVLSAICNVVDSPLPSAWASIDLLDASGQVLERAAAPNVPPQMATLLTRCALDPGKGPAAAAVYRKCSVVAQDSETDPVWQGQRDAMHAGGIQSSWSVPIRDRQQHILGALTVYLGQRLTPGQNEMRTLEAGAGLAALAIERRQEEAALFETVQRFETLVKHAPVGIFLTSASGAPVFINEQLREWEGAAIDGQPSNWYGNVSPGDRTALEQSWSRSVENGSQFASDCELIDAHGVKRNVVSRAVPLFAESGEISGFLGTVTDISPRIRMEKAVDEERARFELAVLGTNDGIWDWDLDRGLFYFSPRFLELLGLSEAGISAGRRPDSIDFFLDRLHASDDNVVREALDDHLAGKGSFDIECRARHNEGLYRWFRLRGIAVFDGIGRPVRMAGSISDVSAAKLANQGLRAMVEELKLARQKAELATRAKADFLAHMSHEIRTPMHGVLGMTGLLLETTLDAEQREYAETVRHSAEALLTVLNEILDMSKIDAGKLQVERIPFEIEPLVSDVVKLLSAKAEEKSLELITHIAPDVPAMVVTDPARLRQILLNLAGNAVKFTDTGFVRLAVDIATGGGEEPRLRIKVRDSGIGIPEDRQSALFQEFTQADASTTRRYGGTGLGLAICRRLAGLMGGSIELESEPGQGSIFSAIFPLETLEAGTAPTLIPESPRVPALAGKRALVLSSLDEQRRAICDFLAWAGVTVETAAGEQPIDIVIVDQRADLDPFEVVRTLKATPQCAKAFFAVLTYLRRRSDKAAFHSAGVDLMVAKPIRPKELISQVAALFSTQGSEIAASGTLLESAKPLDMRILVAEDNLVNQKLAKRVLEKLGCHVDIASNGLEAIDCWRNNSYHLILMDCQMPELDGYEATTEIRRAEQSSGRHRTPILAMTASALDSDRDRCLAHGMDDFLSKPVQIERLRKAIEAYSGECKVEAPESR